MAVAGSGDRDDRHDALLRADAAVLVLLAGLVAANARRDGDAHVVVPVPGHGLLIGDVRRP